MINNDWERFGDEIRRTIQNAVDSKDFRMLNQTVSDIPASEPYMPY